MKKPRTSIKKDIKRANGFYFQRLRTEISDESKSGDKLISIVTEDNNYTEHGVVSELGYPDDKPENDNLSQ